MVSENNHRFEGEKHTQKQDNSYNPEKLMNWTTKAIAASPKEIMKAQLYILLAPTLACIYITWLMWHYLPEDFFDLASMYCIGYGLAIYLIKFSLRQKTFFNYLITNNYGSIEYHLDFSKQSQYFFKGTAIAAIFLFLAAAIYTQSLLFLVGPVAIAFGAAKFLLGWKNELKHEKSLPWSEYNFVTVDRKRLMVITHRTDLTLGFEARFPDEELLEKYLKILHSALPTTAEFSEKRWEW